MTCVVINDSRPCKIDHSGIDLERRYAGHGWSTYLVHQRAGDTLYVWTYDNSYAARLAKSAGA